MWPLYKKELNYFLNNPVGYIIIILFATFANFFYLKDIFAIGSASMRPFFGFVPWLLLIFIPAISMRSFAEERRSNTLETLLSLPILEKEIVLAKFASLMTIIGLGLILTFALPITLFFMTHFSISEVLTSYVGIFLMSSSFTALCLFCSLKTNNQVVAFLVSILVLFLLMILSSDFLASVFPQSILGVVGYFGPGYHLQSFLKGILDFRALFYYLSFTVSLLYLTIVELKKKS